MKPVYNITFSDPIYFHYSDEILANIAVDFLRVFQAANFRRFDMEENTENRLFTSGRLEGQNCVEAKPGKVTIDFSRAVTQGWAF